MFNHELEGYLDWMMLKKKVDDMKFAIVDIDWTNMGKPKDYVERFVVCCVPKRSAFGYMARVFYKVQIYSRRIEDMQLSNKPSSCIYVIR